MPRRPFDELPEHLQRKIDEIGNSMGGPDTGYNGQAQEHNKAHTELEFNDKLSTKNPQNKKLSKLNVALHYGHVAYHWH